MDIPAFEQLFRQIKINLWIVGISYDSKIQLRYHIFFISLSIIVICELAFLFTKWSENVLEFTLTLPCTCCGLWSIMKIVPIAYHKEKIFKLTNELNELYDAIQTNPNKRAVVRKEIYLVKFLIKSYIILDVVLVTVYNFSSSIFMLYNYVRTSKMKFSLPYPALFPFSTDSWPTWSVVNLFSIYTGYICVLYFSTVDALYCALTSQICNNLAIISHEMKHLCKDNVHLLKGLVKNHQFVLKLSEDLEQIFKLPNLFNVLVGSLQICALGFNITVGDWTHLPACILFLVCILSQILLMSVFGEKLIVESGKVNDAAFSCNWYNMDTNSKKTILIILIRSHKPSQLTAYNFSVISHQSFTKIVSTSWSYFTILRTMYAPPQ